MGKFIAPSTEYVKKIKCNNITKFYNMNRCIFHFKFYDQSESIIYIFHTWKISRINSAVEATKAVATNLLKWW